MKRTRNLTLVAIGYRTDPKDASLRYAMQVAEVAIGCIQRRELTTEVGVAGADKGHETFSEGVRLRVIERQSEPLQVVSGGPRKHYGGRSRGNRLRFRGLNACGYVHTVPPRYEILP